MATSNRYSHSAAGRESGAAFARLCAFTALGYRVRAAWFKPLRIRGSVAQNARTLRRRAGSQPKWTLRRGASAVELAYTYARI